MLQIVASLTDNSRGIIYFCNFLNKKPIGVWKIGDIDITCCELFTFIFEYLKLIIFCRYIDSLISFKKCQYREPENPLTKCQVQLNIVFG